MFWAVLKVDSENIVTMLNTDAAWWAFKHSKFEEFYIKFCLKVELAMNKLLDHNLNILIKSVFN